MSTATSGYQGGTGGPVSGDSTAQGGVSFGMPGTALLIFVLEARSRCAIK